MTDISAMFVRDEAVFDLEIKGRDPETNEEVDTGVVFKVRSLKNDDAAKIVKNERRRLFGMKMVSKDEISHEDIGALFLMESGDPTDEQLATCVVGWDWGDNTFGKLSTKYSQENVAAILKAASWIRAQVLIKVQSITDFTKA